MWWVLVSLASAQDKPRLEDNAILATFGATYGAYAGAETGFLIGEALEDDENDHTTQGIAPGMLGGAAIGFTTAYLIGRSNDPSPEAEALLFTTSGHGIFYGSLFADALIPLSDDGRRERIHAAGLAGSMLGVGLGTAFGHRASSIENQARFTLGSGIGWVTATGIHDLAQLGVNRTDTDGDGLSDVSVDRRPRAAVTIGTAAVFGGLAALANQTDTRPGPAGLGLSLGHGAWIGGWSPLLFTDNPDTSQITGGLRLGLGVGYGSSLLMAAFGEPSGRSAGMQVAGWAAGSSLGAGIPLALEGEGPMRVVVGPMLAGGIAGQLYGAALSSQYEGLDANDGVLMGTLGAWTTYQALGWGTYAGYTTSDTRQPIGYGLAAAGAGSLITLGLTPVLDVEPQGSLMLLGAGGWGTWYGGWGSQLGGLDANDTWLTMLAAGNGALVGTAIAEGAGWNPSWTDVAAINGLGMVGAAAGALTGVIFLYEEDNWNPLIISTLTGSTLGLAAGGVLAARSDDGKAPRIGAIRLRRAAWDGALGVAPLEGGAMVRLDLTEKSRDL